MIDKGMCNKGSIRNPSNCKWECGKSCDVGGYLDYENCKCRNRLVDKLAEECSENIDEVKIARITLAKHENVSENKCKSFFTLYIEFLFNDLYNQLWNCYLFCLLQIYKSW